MRILCLLAVAALAAALSACGGSDASQDEIERARTEGAVEAKQQAKIERIEEQLESLKKRRNAAQPPNSSGSAPPPATSSGGNTSCGGDLSVGSNTTCAFAANVENDYYSEIGSGSGTVVSYSPVTGKLYSMYCTAGSPHECTGGNSASVYFP